MESLARQGDVGAQAELANQPALPRHAAYLWRYFLELDATRTSSGFGPNPITRLEIRLWQEDEGVHLDPWERLALLKVDALYLKSLNPTDDPEEEAEE